MTEYPLVQIARKIGVDIAGPNADAVDRDSRFPIEAITALKEAGLLSAYVPTALGGAGASMTELCQICEVLGQHCTATAMVFAMHQIQVVTLVRHAMDSDWYRDYLTRLVKHQYLIASVTSEVGVGGEMRKSTCAVELEGERFKLVKDATTISYGAQADDLLVTSRRNPHASNNDQVLVLVSKDEYSLEQKGVWNTMGMRGTCSPPFLLTATGAAERVMSVPFADMSSQTVVPVSHLVWVHLWLGNVTAAVNKAGAFVRHQARANPGTTPPTALRLAEVTVKLQNLSAVIRDALGEYETLVAGASVDKLSSIAYAFKINNLKVDVSSKLPVIVTEALLICGIMGYKNDSKFAMSRHLRDAHSSALMVGNDRILATNANLLMVLKEY
jgi:acyl-CoA dehydrogenase